MKNYYFLGADGQQYGPVEGSTLKNYGVTGETLVWCEGMDNWAKASTVPELAYLFAAAPTPPRPVTPVRPSSPGSSYAGDVCPDNYLVWSILVTLLCCWPFGIPAIVNSSKVEKLWMQGDKIGAMEKSESAKKWCWISFGCGIIVFILSFLSGFMGAL